MSERIDTARRLEEVRRRRAAVSDKVWERFMEDPEDERRLTRNLAAFLDSAHADVSFLLSEIDRLTSSSSPPA